MSESNSGVSPFPFHSLSFGPLLCNLLTDAAILKHTFWAYFLMSC